MEAWIKPSTTSGSVIDFASASSDYLNRISIAYNGGAVYAETWIESTRYGACTTTPSAPVPLNAWSHVARVTRWLDAQGKTWQVDLYVNGTLATQSLPCAVSANLLASPDSGIYNNNPLDATRGWAYAFVGRPTNFEGTTASFSGLAGEVAVYSRPLTAVRIAAHFAASFALPPSPPPPPPSPPSALSQSGGIMVWGSSTYVTKDVPASTLSDIVAISADYFQALVLRKNGSVTVWGYSSYAFFNTVPAAAESGIAAISAGYHHSLALTTGGGVVAWGGNNNGVTTVPSSAQSGIAAIAAGYGHNLALTSSGTIVAWGGNNSYGELTVPAAALSGVTAVAAGQDFSLALVGGKVVAWGSNAADALVLPAATQSGIVAIVAKCVAVGRPRRGEHARKLSAFSRLAGPPTTF